MPDGQNPYVKQARQIKTIKLAAWLHREGITPEQARQVGDPVWKQWASRAGVNPPSKTTRLQVIEYLDAQAPPAPVAPVATGSSLFDADVTVHTANVPHHLTSLVVGTARYARWDRDHGVPVRTTVGAPRNFRSALAFARHLTPYGVFDHPDPEVRDVPEVYRRHYLEMLNRQWREIDAELSDLDASYPGARLVFLCYCNLGKRGSWCHRQYLAEWLTARYGVDVPELGA